MPELESVLEMYGIQLGSSQCRIIPLPEGASVSDSSTKSSSGGSELCPLSPNPPPRPRRRPFVVLAFPIEDADRLSSPSISNSCEHDSKNSVTGSSSSSSSNNSHKHINNNNRNRTTASVLFEFDPVIDLANTTNDHRIGKGLAWIAEILSKCTLVKSVVELWSCTTTLEKCVQQTQTFLNLASVEWSKNDNDCNASASLFYQNLHKLLYEQKPALLTTTSNDDNQDQDPEQQQFNSWKMDIHTLGQKLPREDQDTMRKAFSPILDDIPGPVQLKHPDMEFLLIHEIELDHKGSPVIQQQQQQPKSKSSESEQLQLEPEPLAFYFGRVLGGGKATRNIHNRFTLKKRPYIGPTSMDAELSFVMTSLGQVRKGAVVYDPFVGTGSILLSCALRGAYVVGSDIDIRVIRGKGGDQTIWKNFESHGLPRPEVIRTDNSLYHRHFRHHHTNSGKLTPNNDQSCLYDAILCDPPYGIRAGARQSGSKCDNPRSVREENRHDHIAQTKAYPVSDVMADLLDVAARTLNMDGRLVYIIPSFRDFDPNTDLPRHDCLELMYSCYQPFSPELGRRIVVMKKTCTYDLSQRQHYIKNVWLNGIQSAEKCINIRDKLIEAAKQKPGYEEKAAIRKQKRRANKEAKKLEKKKRKLMNG